jgi:hypothetical protein
MLVAALQCGRWQELPAVGQDFRFEFSERNHSLSEWMR